MKITSTTLARLCVALLVLYPISAILLWAYLAHDNSYGIMAALLAANAGTALFVGLAFDLPEFSHYTSRALRLTVITIGIVSGLVSAQFWMADEVGHIWFRAAVVVQDVEPPTWYIVSLPFSAGIGELHLTRQ